MLQDLPFVNRQFIENTTIRQNYVENVSAKFEF